MVSNKYPNKEREPASTNGKARDLDKPSRKPTSSEKATNGSLTSASAGSSSDPTALQSRGGSSAGNRDVSSGNGQREAWALHRWREQAPRDEPWRPGSRKT